MSIEINNNTQTLDSYQNKTEAYIEGTPEIDSAVKAWIDGALALTPAPGRILEVGSGFGRDAEYFRKCGHEVECSDAVPNFVDILQARGFNARLLNLLTDNYDGPYDMVFADAVLLHFNAEETADVVEKIHAALNPNGIFAFGMKKGDGAVWTEEKIGAPRYFYYWQPEDLRLLLEHTGFTWLEMIERYTAHNDANWMYIIAKKA